MATFKNQSGADLEVWIDGTAVFVREDESFDVSEEHADGLRLQPNFKEQTPAPAVPEKPAAAEKEKN